MTREASVCVDSEPGVSDALSRMQVASTGATSGPSSEALVVLTLSEKEKFAFRSHPLKPVAKGIPSFDEWPQYPILVTQSKRPAAKQPDLSLKVDNHPDKESHNNNNNKVVCINSKPIKVDSSLFEGETFIFVQDVKTSGIGEDASKELEKRRSSFTLKGRFKRRVRFSDLVIGHEFNEGIVSPPNWQRHIILGFLNKFFPYLQISLGERASALAPVLVDCRRMKVSRRNTASCGEGRERELELHGVEEETTLLGGYFAQKPRTSRERMRYFKSKQNLEKFWFDPDLDYTFEFYQNNLSFTDYKLHFGFFSVGIGRIIKGNPVQFLIKSSSTREYLCYFQFWSARLLGYV